MTRAWSLLVAAVSCAAACAPSTRAPGSCDGPCPAAKKIDHLIVVVQENHTFDNYFAKYCTAAPGSSPTCTQGAACCEAGPGSDASGAAPSVLDDTANAAYDPDHTQACELAEADGGLMDKYASGVNECSDPRNFAYADASTVQPYWDLAAKGALADHYFQPVSGQSSSNDMYLARAQFVFLDDMFEPPAIGAMCSTVTVQKAFTGTTIADLLTTAHVSWGVYAEGYADMATAYAKQTCPKPPKDCPFGVSLYPCIYDPDDIPFEYFPQLADDSNMYDFTQLQADLTADTLPQVAFVKGLGYHTEHPGEDTTISDGVTFVTNVVDAIQQSDYAPDTLILVTWDEGGGFYDHVAPPGMGAVDNQPYGTRIPLIAVGPAAATNAISHTVMEHSSIVKFIEWNWLGMQTGQLAGRDTTVANLGSMLDATATGVAVPSE